MKLSFFVASFLLLIQIFPSVGLSGGNSCSKIFTKKTTIELESYQQSEVKFKNMTKPELKKELENMIVTGNIHSIVDLVVIADLLSEKDTFRNLFIANSGKTIVDKRKKRTMIYLNPPKIAKEHKNSKNVDKLAKLGLIRNRIIWQSKLPTDQKYFLEAVAKLGDLLIKMQLKSISSVPLILKNQNDKRSLNPTTYWKQKAQIYQEASHDLYQLLGSLEQMGFTNTLPRRDKTFSKLLGVRELMAFFLPFVPNFWVNRSIYPNQNNMKEVVESTPQPSITRKTMSLFHKDKSFKNLENSTLQFRFASSFVVKNYLRTIAFVTLLGAGIAIPNFIKLKEAFPVFIEQAQVEAQKRTKIAIQASREDKPPSKYEIKFKISMFKEDIKELQNIKSPTDQQLAELQKYHQLLQEYQKELEILENSSI